MLLVDTHAHLDEQAFDPDRDAVVERARQAGLAAIVTVGITAETSRRAAALAKEFDIVHAVVGIQPNYAAEAAPHDWEEIERLAREPNVVGIGETGLDRYWDYAPLQVQTEFFARHIELSQRLDLPFVVHCREAEDEVVDQLKKGSEAGPLKGVMHSFCGRWETARACLDLGLYISFAGMVTYKKNDALRSVAAQVPLDRILIETDSPYLSPEPVRKIRRNEPAHIVHINACLAAVHGISAEQMAARTSENARQLFGIPFSDET